MRSIWLLAARRERTISHLRRTGRSAHPLCGRLGLHAYRAAPDQRASARPILGLSAHRPVCADPSLRRAGGVRPLCDRAHRAGLGVIVDWVPAHFPTDAQGWRISTAPRSTNTPTRARASTRIGTPRSTISAASRSPTSSIGTRSTGSTASILTGCASTRSPRCSISTTRAAQANGCQILTAAGKIVRRSPFCAAPTSSSTAASPGRSPSLRNRPPFRGFRGRPIRAVSASASSGTWAGCTIRSTTCRRIRSIAVGITTR